MEIALGVVLGLLGVVLAGLAAFVAARRAGRRPPVAAAPPPAAGGPEQDDLPGFLEFPPGAGSPPAGPVAGWPSLAPAPPVPTPAPPRSKDSRAALGVIVAVAVLLVALGVAVATSGGDRRPHDNRAHGSPAPGSQAPMAAPGTAGALADETLPVGDDGIAARLAFDGAVLERHPVGVTATYPRLRLSSDGRRAVMHLELPTFHCLAAEAPGDPVAAGCSRAVAEYADLDSPGLRVTRSGDRMRLSGQFATYVRPNGGPAEWTGRTYRIEVTVRAVADHGTAQEGWQPAEGVLVLGDDRANTTGDAEVNAVRLGS